MTKKQNAMQAVWIICPSKQHPSSIYQMWAADLQPYQGKPVSSHPCDCVAAEVLTCLLSARAEEEREGGREGGLAK